MFRRFSIQNNSSKSNRLLSKLARKLGKRNESQRRVIRAVKSLESDTTKKQSILFFTTHKCASTFIANLLKLINDISDYDTYDYAGALYQLGNRVDAGDPFDFMSSSAAELFRSKGEIYGPLRKPIEFCGREKMKHVFFLRDPRDVAVSAYYSFGYSHILPENEQRKEIFLKEREKILGETIDEYVIRATNEWIIPVFKKYQEFRECSDSSLFISYDTYRESPQAFVRELLAYMELQNTDSRALEKYITEVRPVQKNKDERLMQHQRSGRSRQFEDELHIKTQKIILSELSPLLQYWGFSE